MLSSLFKYIVQIALKIFFRKIVIVQSEAMPNEGPMIVAANHPSTIMDASVVGCLLKQKPKFLTKATVFKKPLNRWLLQNMGAIPVQRAADSPDGKADTKFLFSKCFERLAAGDTILIFPEGVSKHGRQLHKIKTGAARIALGAEGEHAFGLGIKIITVGLNYSNPRRFRSDLYITIKPAIQVSDWQQTYIEDERLAVQQLTAKISNQLQEQIIVTQDAAEDNLLQQIEDIYQNTLIDQIKTDEQLETKQFKASKSLEEALRYYQETDAQRVAQLRIQLDNYFYNLQRLKLKDDLLESKALKQSIFTAAVLKLLGLLLGFSIWLYGLLNNYLAYRIPSLLAQFITKDEEYIAPIMMYIGILSFPIFYGLQIYLFSYLEPNFYGLFFYMISLPISGFFALHYWQRLKDTKDQWTLFSSFYSKKKLFSKIITQRAAIVQELEEAQQIYTELLDRQYELN